MNGTHSSPSCNSNNCTMTEDHEEEPTDERMVEMDESHRLTEHLPQHVQPFKKRKSEHLTERIDYKTDSRVEEQPCDLTSKEKPIDFSFKSTDPFNGPFGYHSISRSVVRDNFEEGSTTAFQWKNVYNNPEYLPEESTLKESPSFIMNPFHAPIKRDTLAQFLRPIRNTKVEDNSSKEGISPINNTSFSAFKLSNFTRDEGVSFRGEVNSGNNGNGNLPLIGNGFNPLPYPSYSPPVPAMQRFYYNTLPLGLTKSHPSLRDESLDISFDRRPSKSQRPFKEFEDEIINYPLSHSSPTYVSSRYSYLSRRNSVPSNNTPISSPIEQEQNRSSNSNDSTEMENNSQNDYVGDSQLLADNSSCGAARRRGQKIPEDKKDAIYLEKRRKNNEAAKRSRDARRKKEDQIATKAKEVIEENKMLTLKLQQEMHEKTKLENELRNVKIDFMNQVQFLHSKLLTRRIQCKCPVAERDGDPKISALLKTS